jgi:hypothetical protein
MFWHERFRCSNFGYNIYKYHWSLLYLNQLIYDRLKWRNCPSSYLYRYYGCKLRILVTMHRHTKLFILTDSLNENGIDGLINSSYGSDLAWYKFRSLSVIKEALYNQRFESCRTVKIAISQCIKGVPKDAQRPALYIKRLRECNYVNEGCFQGLMWTFVWWRRHLVYTASIFITFQTPLVLRYFLNNKNELNFQEKNKFRKLVL